MWIRFDIFFLEFSLVATAVVVVAVARVRGRVTTGDRDAVVVFGSAWRRVGWSTRAMVVVIEVLSATALVFASSPLLLVRSAAMHGQRARPRNAPWFSSPGIGRRFNVRNTPECLAHTKPAWFRIVPSNKTRALVPPLQCS